MGIHVEVEEKDHGWDELLKTFEQVKNSYAKTGVFADSPEANGHEADKKTGKASELTIGEIAAIHEFGTTDGHVPERSFLRSTFDEKHQELEKMGEKLIGAVFDHKIRIDAALNMMGSKLAAWCKNKITEGEGVPPPNAPSTIKAKGSDRPLVDTGRLVNAITWEITVNGSDDGGHEGGESGGGGHGHE